MTSAHSDIHFSALCNAIEHEKCEKARAILETHPALLLDQNNNDGFTPLDLAFMTGNQEILKLLIHHRHDEHSGKKKLALPNFNIPKLASPSSNIPKFT